ncbi:Thymidylate synthase complementing protein [uncultured virus]|nr:Thymidylate synthase complementing protein [uncultured virus]
MTEAKEYDAFTLVKDKTRTLLDGKGSVTLVDLHPRICPEGWTPEFRIVQAARVSYGKGLTTPEKDAGLTRYLMANRHTSPVEMCGVTLRLELPGPIAVHFLRHRTGKFNQFSQRYSEVKEATHFYDPTVTENGIRGQSKTNKQASALGVLTEEETQRIAELMKQANELNKQQHALYKQMVDAGCAKEIARFYLPNGEYTTLYMQFDLNNLIKLLELRADKHAQWETQQYALAIIDLCKPLFPTVFRVYEERVSGLFLSGPELEAFRNGAELTSKSETEQVAYKKKRSRLLIKQAPTEAETVSVEAKPELPKPVLVEAKPELPQDS